MRATANASTTFFARLCLFGGIPRSEPESGPRAAETVGGPWRVLSEAGGPDEAERDWPRRKRIAFTISVVDPPKRHREM